MHKSAQWESSRLRKVESRGLGVGFSFEFNSAKGVTANPIIKEEVARIPVSAGILVKDDLISLGFEF